MPNSHLYLFFLLIISKNIIISSSGEGIVDFNLLQFLFSNPSKSADVLVYFVGENFEAIENIESRNFPDRVTKISALVSRLESHAEFTQGPLIQFLKIFPGVKVQSFWVSNQMVIENINLFILQQILSAFPQISRVQEHEVITLFPPIQSHSSEIRTAGNTNNVTWGIDRMQAPKVWTDLNTTGVGIVVAHIDTGVCYTHDALFSRYRSFHGWFDSTGNSTTPRDGNGHGTHTMGTITGDFGIGVAPGAQWIACKGLDDRGIGSIATLLNCGEWCISPTDAKGNNKNSALAPHVVSNSWGGTSAGGDIFFNATVRAFTTAGILTVFAIGNAGPGCSTCGSPGDQQNICSLGSMNINNNISSFSSKGPSNPGNGQKSMIKPEVVAPGENINSTWCSSTSNNTYKVISGTSMATPHAAGVLALIASFLKALTGKSNPILNNTSIFYSALQQTTVTNNLNLAAVNQTCNKMSNITSTSTFPNNTYGNGTINAYNAVSSFKNGTLTSS